MSGRRLNPSERRTITWGAVALLVGVLWATVAAPASRRWSDRETAIETARDRVARLRGLNDNATALVNAANQPMGPGLRVLTGRTAALVASDLQSLLQDIARSARVSVNRMDVQTLGDSLSSADRGVDAVVSATTDIYGLADFLSRLQSNEVVLSVDALQVEPNPVLRGSLLQVSLTVRAPYLVTP